MRLADAMNARRSAGTSRPAPTPSSSSTARLASSKNLVAPANITLLTLPPYSPELNPVENIWQFLRQNRLANRIFESYDAIVDVCCDAWNALLAIPERVASITSREWAQVSR